MLKDILARSKHVLDRLANAHTAREPRVTIARIGCAGRRSVGARIAAVPHVRAFWAPRIVCLLWRRVCCEIQQLDTCALPRPRLRLPQWASRALALPWLRSKASGHTFDASLSEALRRGVTPCRTRRVAVATGAIFAVSVRVLRQDIIGEQLAIKQCVFAAPAGNATANTERPRRRLRLRPGLGL